MYSGIALFPDAKSHPKKYLMVTNKKFNYMIVAAMFGVLVPLGQWIFLQLTADTDMALQILNYCYTGVVAAILFGCIGYLIGSFRYKRASGLLKDSLTSLFTRQSILQKLTAFLKNNDRLGEQFCVLLFEVDNFKHMNAEHGNLVGDFALVKVAQCIEKYSRRKGSAGRYGASSFLLLCPRFDIKKGRNVADKIRKKICKIKGSEFGLAPQLTISVAVFVVPPGLHVSGEEVLGILQKGIVDVKNLGGNSVSVGRE